jgi:hypothetical protein
MAKYFLAAISLASFASVLLLFGALVIAPPSFQLPPVGVVDEVFRIANLFFLGYIIYFLVRKLESLTSKVSELMNASIAFVILWIAQFSSLIWGVDGSLTAFVAAHVARIISLVLFIRIYYLAGRGIDERQ